MFHPPGGPRDRLDNAYGYSVLVFLRSRFSPSACSASAPEVRRMQVALDIIEAHDHDSVPGAGGWPTSTSRKGW